MRRYLVVCVVLLQLARTTDLLAQQESVPMTPDGIVNKTEEAASPSVPADDAIDVEAEKGDAASSFDPDPTCENGVWNLTGAATEHKSGNVSYQEEWTPLLEQAAGCIAKLTGNEFCVLVQGQYDNVPFPPRVVATFGGQRPAQLARATARSAMVADRLRQMGVNPDVIQLLPPPSEAQFRGASVTIDKKCNPEQRGDTVVLVVKSDDGVTREALGDVVAATLVADEKRKEEEQKKKQKPSPHWLFGDVAFNWAPLAIAVGDNRRSAVHYFLEGAIGWHSEWLYARVKGGAALGHPEEYKAAAGIDAAFGFYYRNWLQLGVYTGLLYAYPGEPTWLHRSWHLGVEGTHCFGASKIKIGEVCVREAIAPIGRATARLELENGAPVRINEKDEYALRFELGFMMRFFLIRGDKHGL